MIINKEEKSLEKDLRKSCCHCCRSCYSCHGDRIQYTKGRCAICPKFGKKCPYGLQPKADEDEQIKFLPQTTNINGGGPLNRSNFEGGTRPSLGGGGKPDFSMPKYPPRPSSAHKPTVITSQIINQPNLVRRSMLPISQVIYPTIEIRPVYYNVTVPITLDNFKNAKLSNSVAEQKTMAGGTNSRRENLNPRMKQSTSTFDRSKMRMDELLDSISRGKQEPIHPQQIRKLITAFSLQN